MAGELLHSQPTARRAQPLTTFAPPRIVQQCKGRLQRIGGYPQGRGRLTALGFACGPRPLCDVWSTVMRMPAAVQLLLLTEIRIAMEVTVPAVQMPCH